MILIPILSGRKKFIEERSDIGKIVTSQKEKNEYCILKLNIECKKWYRLSYLQNSNRDTENKCKDTKEGRGWGGRNREIGIDLYTLLILCIKRN